MSEITSNAKDEIIKGMTILKGLNMINPPRDEKGDDKEVAIYKSLKSEDEIKKKVLRMMGYAPDYVKGGWIKIRMPVMNDQGIGNYIAVLHGIADMEFANIDEKEVNKVVYHLFEENFPYFISYAEEYNLSDTDFNLISTELLSFIFSTVKKAKGAGHRNVIRNAYSEETVARAFPNVREKDGLFDKFRGNKG